MSLLWTIAIVSVTSVVIFWAWSLYRNYRAALHVGLPIVLTPLEEDGVPIILVKVLFNKYAETILKSLGRLTPGFDLMPLQKTWEFRDKYRMHQRHGPTFILVTPAGLTLWCADPDIAQSVASRRKDFLLSHIAKVIMRFPGQNLLSCDGDDWARQRRLIAPTLNERISKAVWTESFKQARQMASRLPQAGAPRDETLDTLDCTQAIAMNVLIGVLYGDERPFAPLVAFSTDSSGRAGEMSYVDAIIPCVQNIGAAALLPRRIFPLPLIPGWLKNVGIAVERLPRLTRDMLDQERQRAAAGKDTRGNVMSMLVRLSDAAKASKDPVRGDEGKSLSGQYLKEDEIAGNLFLFTAAGFDSTGNTMCYAVAALAAFPEWQAWIQEEIDYVLGGVDREAVPDYQTVYPKLLRCLALMFETVRLFPPLPTIKRTIRSDQVVTTRSGTTLPLRAPMKVYTNVVALHTHPSYWGTDSLEFRPSRWISDGKEELITPVAGTFMAWNRGPRVCPGMKMAQVEFVTVMATLFGTYTVKPVKTQGETMQEARRRIWGLTQDSSGRFALQMDKAHEMRVKWVQRVKQAA